MPTAIRKSSFASMDLVEVNRLLQGRDASGIIRWSADSFADGLVMSSSFGAESACMLHLVTQVVPAIPVIFIDTGYLFPETYRFADELARRFNLNLKVYQSSVSSARMEATQGRLWENGVEAMNEYDRLRKVEPMQRALAELRATAWLAGLRKNQTDFRAGLRFVESQDGLAKIHPILNWTTQDVHEYLKKHDLPYHPLYDKGYKSIGDAHTTRPIGADETDRSGRFAGLKQECGLHLPKSAEENHSRESSDL